MKILHVGQGLMPAISRELSISGAYRFIDWTEYVDMGQVELFRKELVKSCNDMKPDIIFLHIQRPDVITPNELKQIEGYVINWTYDVLEPIPSWYYELAPYLDLTLFCNDEDVEKFKTIGYESDYLQIGYDDLIFKNEGSRSDTYGDIVFLGNNYHAGMNYPLTGMRSKMVAFLKGEYGDSFKVYGNNWPYNDGNLMYKEELEAECYRSCKMAINFSHFDRGRYTSDRMFRIMGSGALCLTKWYPGIEKDFIDGEHLRVWKTFDDLKLLIDYYLENPNEGRIIAQRGMIHVQKTCTWKNRIKQLIEMANGKISKEYKSRIVRIAQQYNLKPQQIPTQQDTPIERKEDDSTYSDRVEEQVNMPVFSFQPGLRHVEVFHRNLINYNLLKRKCFFKPIDGFKKVDISVIIPVRSRTYFNKFLTKCLRESAERTGLSISITFVEHSDYREHENFCEDTNYIHIPSYGGPFNKCMCFNIGAMYGNDANKYLFHDLDIMMDHNFFEFLLLNYKRVNERAVQSFRGKRVLYCDEELSQRILNNQIPMSHLSMNHPGITVPAQHRAPGGSIFVSKEQFLEAGGYDAELFFGYSIEDQFFYDKLQLTGGIHSCDSPIIEVYHLYHPPLWNSNPLADDHADLYQNFLRSTPDEKYAFMTMESNNIKNYLH